jgi:hypothetical protein
MNCAIRWLILVAVVLLAGLAVKTGWFVHLLERGIPQVLIKSDGKTRLPGPNFETGSKPPMPPPSTPVEDPKEDLLLTGMVGGTTPFAVFRVTEPDKPPVSFTLAVGEQNEWLEVRSIDADSGTVKALLKKPVVRIRNTEVEVILSFQAHGARQGINANGAN